MSAARAARVAQHLRRRRRKEAVFRSCGAVATAIGIVFLGCFLLVIGMQASAAFSRSFAVLDVDFAVSGGPDDPAAFARDADFDAMLRAALWRAVPQATGADDRRELLRLISIGAPFTLRDAVMSRPSLVGQRAELLVPVNAVVDAYLQSDREPAAARRGLSERQVAWIEQLRADGALVTRFNWALFRNGDSREPELAGIRGALIGSLYMMLLTAALSLPVGIAAAVYLEEFARQNRWTDIIEVNINNLAAVPSIIYGLLGLAVFIDWFQMPRSAPVVGGLVLSLLTLPVVIIASRAAIAAVPETVRHAALALGASRMQTVFHHVLPIAMPRILTGAVLGLSRALGETAPLLMIGMVAFIADVPTGFGDPATALPVQIYLWADAPEPAFAEQTAAAIVVLLGILLLMNLAAVMIRRRLERRH